MARGKYVDWLTDDGLLRITGWARDGLTNEQIAHNIGITTPTLWDWCNKYPKISNALKEGKAPVDLEVENALLKSALGFKEKVRKPIKRRIEKQVAGKGKIVEEVIDYVEEEVYVPPQTVAQVFWLKNRRPDRWRDKPVEKPTEGTSPIDQITEQIFKLQKEQAEAQDADTDADS